MACSQEKSIVAYFVTISTFAYNSEQLVSDWSGQVPCLIYAPTMVIALFLHLDDKIFMFKIVTSPLFHLSLPLHCFAFISTAGECVFNIFGHKPKSIFTIESIDTQRINVIMLGK